MANGVKHLKKCLLVICISSSDSVFPMCSLEKYRYILDIHISILMKVAHLLKLSEPRKKASGWKDDVSYVERILLGKFGHVIPVPPGRGGKDSVGTMRWKANGHSNI